MKHLLLVTVTCVGLSLPAMAQNNAPTTRSQQQAQAIKPSSLSKQQIRQVQTDLDKAGFNVKGVDGKWGKKTSEALRKFQQAKNLPGNGRLNQQTFSALGVDISSQFQASNSLPKQMSQQASSSSRQTGQSRQFQTRGNGTSSLSAQQKQMIAQKLSAQSAEQPPANFNPTVGQNVPPTLKLSQLPGNVTDQVQSLKGDDFAKLNDGKILIVNPSSKQIVAVINERSTTGSGNSSANKNVTGNKK
jgi:Putative peptidoglycan binding domain